MSHIPHMSDAWLSVFGTFSRPVYTFCVICSPIALICKIFDTMVWSVGDALIQACATTNMYVNEGKYTNTTHFKR